MTLTGYDAAFAPATPPAVQVVCFYAPGGDQYHAWPLADIDAQTARYRLPIFVRSNPYQASVLTDAQNFMAWLRSIGCPKGVATVLDLETAVAPAYVSAFASQMHAAGYLVLPYGSSSTLYRNPVCDGYWVHSPGAQSIPSNCVGVQYGQGGSGAWDLDLFSASIPLWDTQPPPPDPPAPVQLKEKPVLIVEDGTTQYLLFEGGRKVEIANPADLTTLAATVPALAGALTPEFVASIPNV